LARRVDFASTFVLVGRKTFKVRGFLSFAFGKLGKRETEVVGCVSLDGDGYRPRTLETRFFCAKLKILEKPDGFCAKARKSVPIEQEQTEETESTSQRERCA
jgi:hypothetical protein